MPPISQSQRRWAFANKDKPGAEGRAAKEFADSDPGGKLPEHVSEAHRRRAVRYNHPKSKAARGER